VSCRLSAGAAAATKVPLTLLTLGAILNTSSLMCPVLLYACCCASVSG
jgi:hypothetical protein